MKNIKIILTMLVLMTLGLGACNDELAQPPVIIPEGGIGTGAWDNPMTVYQVGLGSVNNAFESCWVKGYIVGYVNIDVANVLKDETAVFTTPATVKTNILLAATADEKDWTKCIPVQLPSGPVRNALNVADHADNMGKEVCILGSTGSKYCSAYGLRSASAYKWGDKGDESIDNKKPETPVVTGQTIYSALDASDSSLDPEWTIENVSLATGLNYVWSWKDYNGQYYLNASAYAQNKANAALAYCYSPVISLDGFATAAFSFEHAAKFQTTIKELCKAVVRAEGATEWTDLEIPTWPGTTSWAFVNSGEIDLSAYVGKKVQIGFKYESSDAGADTWEIKNVKVTGTK